MEKSDDNQTALFHLMPNEYSRFSVEVVSMLIKIGGRELVMVKDSDGCTILHSTLRFRHLTGVISKLIEVGGRELVMEKCRDDRTTLHVACKHYASIEVVTKLILQIFLNQRTPYYQFLVRPSIDFTLYLSMDLYSSERPFCALE